jgi:feruloyl esterase
LYYGSTGYSTIVVSNDLADDPFTEEQLEIVSQKAVLAGDTAITGHHDGYVTDWQNNRYDPTKDPSVLRKEDGGDATADWAISMKQAHALNKVWYGATKDGSAPDPAVDNGASLELSGSRLYYGKQRGIRLRYMDASAPPEVPGNVWATYYQNESLGEPGYFKQGQRAWANFSYATFAQYMEGGPALDAEFIHMDGVNPDLSAFQSKGGKLLTYHGIADYFSPVQHTADYFERSANYTGGLESTLDFHRVFFVPGMTHCFLQSNQAGYAAIPFPDVMTIFDQLVDWTERRVSPSSLLATTPDGSKSRPICPYPKLPTYNSTGDPDQASSFTC